MLSNDQFGKNKLSGMMGRLSTEAGVSRRYTNHCIRATVATGLTNNGMDVLSIMAVTGHLWWTVAILLAKNGRLPSLST